MTRTLVRTTAVALATAALAAPTALARPDAPPAVARSTVPALHKGLHTAESSRFATRPVLDRNATQPSQPSQPSAPPVTVTVARADHHVDWATIGIGIGGSLIVVGAVALINDRMRRAHARISA
jgi:hypothetical protein